MSKRLKISKKLLKPFVTPQQFDFWSRELGSTVAWDRCHARVVAVSKECDNTVNLKLRPNSHFSGFVAGQHVNLTAEINGVRVTRCYSMTNVPADNTVDITVRKEPNGSMSTWLTEQAKVGSVVELGQVFGELRLPTDSNTPLVLLAAGSGITPMMSLIRQAAANNHCPAITLLYWDKTAAQFCFADELDELNLSSSQITVHKITTQEQPSGLVGGRINSQQLAELVPDLAESKVYACGSSGFVEAAKAIADPIAKSFQAEAFTPAQTVSPPDVEQHFEVQLLKSGRSITLSNQDNLLSALEAEGVAIDSGCRMGNCNTCTCQKREGTTLDTTNGQMNAEKGAAIRLCVNRAVQNLQLEL